MKINMIICFLIGIVLGWACSSSITYLPKDSLMMGKLMRIQRAIQKYYEKNRTCPDSLDELKENFELHGEHLKTDSSKEALVYYSVTEGTNVILRISENDDCIPDVRQVFVLEFAVRH